MRTSASPAAAAAVTDARRASATAQRRPVTPNTTHKTDWYYHANGSNEATRNDASWKLYPQACGQRRLSRARITALMRVVLRGALRSSDRLPCERNKLLVCHHTISEL